MIDCPKTALSQVIIPKEKFYKIGDVTGKIKRLFIDEIDRITLLAVIAPRTMNITGKTYDELNVIEIKLKTSEINTKVLESIDSVIPRPVLFTIVRTNGETKYAISYKTPKSRDANKSKVVHYYETQWDTTRLNISGNSVKAIYVNFIKQIDNSFDITKPLGEAVAITQENTKLKKQIELLNKQISTEISISKRQELAHERHTLQKQLDQRDE